MSDWPWSTAPPISARTAFATRRRHICSKAVLTCAACRRSSGTPHSPRPRSIRTSATSVFARHTGSPIQGPEPRRASQELLRVEGVLTFEDHEVQMAAGRHSRVAGASHDLADLDAVADGDRLAAQVVVRRLEARPMSDDDSEAVGAAVTA